MDDSPARKASDLLSAILSPEVAAKADSWTKFFGFWKRAAGENLAAHSRPVDVRNGIVFVEAEHPGWIQLLQMEQDRILSAVRRTFPELGISGIAFKLAKDGSLPGLARTKNSAGGQSLTDGGQSLEERGLGGPDQAGTDQAGAGGEASGERTGVAGGSTGDRASNNGDRASSGKLPTVKQTIDGVADEGFKGILTSLAKTLGETGGRKGDTGPA